jgi:ribonuclease P protein component
MMGRIVRAVDFERVLKTSTQSRSPHFAVHHLSAAPSRAPQPRATAVAAKLSTAGDTAKPLLVDDPAPSAVWLGVVVPKRHAKRSVTRTLLKRQIRAAMLRQVVKDRPAAGLWVVRLRAPFDRAGFPSAASLALAQAAGVELDRVLSSAALRLRAAADLL